MVGVLVNLSLEHSLLLILAALTVCAVSSWLMLALLDLARLATPQRRVRKMIGAGCVAGLAVWATHFTATLGLRLDFALSFDPLLTITSALAAMVAFGVPISLTALTGRPVYRAICGALGGFGVGAMHVIGMSAITNCTIASSLGETLMVTALGSVVMGLAFSVRPDHLRALRIALVTIAVCIIHFGTIAVSDIHVRYQSVNDLSNSWLAVSIGAVVLILCIMTGYAVNYQARLADQTRHRVLLSTALNNMSNGLVFIGADDRIQLFNDRALAIFGLESDVIHVGMSWRLYLTNVAPVLGWNEARLARVKANHERWFSAPDVTYLEHDLDDGRTVSVACRPILGGGAVLTYDDITAERRAQKEIERLAFEDDLTALPNRRQFQKSLEDIFLRNIGAFLILIDLDHFKNVNDTLGHSAGDDLLVTIGHRLRSLCEREDFVARMAGDEFSVIVLSDDRAYVTALCRRIISHLSAPIKVTGGSVIVGCSVGYASTFDTACPSLLVQYADLALYRAKALGRGHYRGYEAGMREAALQRVQIESDLRTALEDEQFRLAFQPIYRVNPSGHRHGSALIGFEALVRWHHPVRGVVSPADFIPVAEETGLIREIGRWVSREACRQAARWPEAIRVCINVSPVQLRDNLFPEHLSAILAETGVTPSRVEIELTETALVDDSDQIAAVLRALRNTGIRVSMDDFGTGYSSFAHLREFHLDCVKIDQGFVRAAPSDAGARSVLEAIVHMAKALGVSTTGEGVETQAQLETLAACGCDAVQGYFFNVPMDADSAADLCAESATSNQVRTCILH